MVTLRGPLTLKILDKFPAYLGLLNTSSSHDERRHTYVTLNRKIRRLSSLKKAISNIHGSHIRRCYKLFAFRKECKQCIFQSSTASLAQILDVK